MVLLFVLFISGIVLLLAGAPSIANVFPLILVMVGLVIIFFGAFFDFGANRYINNMFQTKASLREKDIVQINREQLIMTVIFVGVGGLYILMGVALFYLIAFF
jgi:glucan phosphoethanolaminetransferase (alkaline phosphatase superfamily)